MAPIITVTNRGSLRETYMFWEFKTSLYSINDTEIHVYHPLLALLKFQSVR